MWRGMPENARNNKSSQPGAQLRRTAQRAQQRSAAHKGAPLRTGDTDLKKRSQSQNGPSGSVPPAAVRLAVVGFLLVDLRRIGVLVAGKVAPARQVDVVALAVLFGVEFHGRADVAHR